MLIGPLSIFSKKQIYFLEVIFITFLEYQIHPLEFIFVKMFAAMQLWLFLTMQYYVLI